MKLELRVFSQYQTGLAWVKFGGSSGPGHSTDTVAWDRISSKSLLHCLRNGRCEVYRQSRTSDDIHPGLPSYSIPFTNNLESEIEVENEDCPKPQGHGEATRGKMEKKEAVSIPGFFLLHLHAFPEPHRGIQPALLYPTSESCPRPGHVTWLAATGSHGDF